MKKLIIALGMLVPTMMFGQIDRTIVPAAAPAKAISIADPVVFKTANGITVILSENHKIPRVSFTLTVGNGQQLEGSKAGVSNLAGSLITSGTPTLTKDQIDAKIDYIGARFSASGNSINLSCLTKHMNEGLAIFSDVLMNANFPQKEFDREIKMSQQSLMQVESDAESMGENALMSKLFPNHPYGEVVTPQTLANITRDDVATYYKNKFVAEGSYLVIVGAITKAQAETIVNKYFGSWAGKLPAKPSFETAKKLNGNRVIFVSKKGAVQSYIQVANAADLKTGDADMIASTVTNSIFGGGGFGTRLMQNLREDKAYTYGSYSGLNIQEQGSYVSVSGNFKNDVTDSAIVEILKELDKMADSYVTNDELSSTLAVMAGSFARSLEHAQTIARFALNIERYNLPKDYYKNYLTKLAAVSKDDVLHTAQKHLTAKGYYIVVVGNEAVLEKLKQFDADGVVEVVDAFGKPVKEMKKADITAEQLFEKYSLYITNSTTAKQRDKKLKKVKSYEIISDMSMPQIPFPLTSKSMWEAPNKTVDIMEGQGMVFQKSYFDGQTGYEMDMQTGKKELSAEQIESKKKATSFIPELYYTKTDDKYEILGIEEVKGLDLYVVKIVSVEGNETYEYYSTKDFSKVQTITITLHDGEAIQTTVTYSDYKDVNGLKFSHKQILDAGEAIFTITVKSITMNATKVATFK